MNWIIIVLCMLPLCIIGIFIVYMAQQKKLRITGICLIVACFIVVFSIGVPLDTVQQNIYEKYVWYIETRLKYAEAEGIEKMYLEANDVMTYNLWYERNKADLKTLGTLRMRQDVSLIILRLKEKINEKQDE